MTNQITYTKKDYFENVIVSFNLPQDLPYWLEKELTFFELFETPGQSYMPGRRQLNNLVIKCDHANQFNPSKFEVERNNKIMHSLLDAGATEAN